MTTNAKPVKALTAETIDAILSELISLARGDQTIKAAPLRRLRGDAYEGGEGVLVAWSGRQNVIEAIEKERGLDAQGQFDRGIVSMLSKIESLVISDELRRSYDADTLARLPYFDAKGNFRADDRKDIIVPIRRDGLITGLAFYSIAEMKKWPKRTQA